MASNFTDYINRVAFRGERFTLMRGSKPVAEFRPVPAGKRLGELPSLLASPPRFSPEDRSTFDADLERARTEMSEQPLQDPWAS